MISSNSLPSSVIDAETMLLHDHSVHMCSQSSNIFFANFLYLLTSSCLYNLFSSVTKFLSLFSVRLPADSMSLHQTSMTFSRPPVLSGRGILQCFLLCLRLI